MSLRDSFNLPGGQGQPPGISGSSLADTRDVEPLVLSDLEQSRLVPPEFKLGAPVDPAALSVVPYLPYRGGQRVGKDDGVIDREE